MAGYVSIRGAPLLVAVVNSPGDAPPWPTVVRDTERQVMVLLAGPLAEAKLLGTTLRSHSCESDLRRAEALCRALGLYRNHLVVADERPLPPLDPAALANALRRKTARILARREVWHAVAALAGDLEGWGSLSGHDAADTVQWTRRVHRQLALLLPMPKPREASGPAGSGNGPFCRFPASPRGFQIAPWLETVPASLRCA